MPRIFTVKISEEELKQKILDAWKNHQDYKIYLKDLTYPNMDRIETIVDAGNMHNLTKQIEKDLEKVEFDPENRGLVGFKQLSNGLTCLLVWEGGDWEQPVHYIVYWDGIKLRAYIPEDGNPWNTSSNKAYGNCYEDDEEEGEESDFKNAVKRGFLTEDASEDDVSDIEPDHFKIAMDIQKRIQYK